MKIPLQIDKEKGFSFLLARIDKKSLHIFGHANFLFDSGSPVTIISEKDAIKLRIPTHNLNDSKPILGWGGATLNSKNLKEVTLTFINTDKKYTKVTMDVKVCISRSPGKKRQISKGHPNVIGMDFLIKNGYKAVLDPDGESYFEKED